MLKTGWGREASINNLYPQPSDLWIKVGLLAGDVADHLDLIAIPVVRDVLGVIAGLSVWSAGSPLCPPVFIGDGE